MADDPERNDHERPSSSDDAGMLAVSFELDMEPEQFAGVTRNFIARLAELLDVEPSAVAIVSVKRGCTKLIVIIPRSRIDELKLLQESFRGRSKAALPRQMQAFNRDFKIKDFSRVPEGELILLTPKQLGIGREFTWLHLSDAHFQGRSGSQHFGQNKVAEALLRDVADVLGEEGVEPDVVFFTGDIADSGAKQEYDIALNFVERLRDVLPKEGTPFLFVPGNHDVDRSVVKAQADEEATMDRTVVNNDGVFEFLCSEKHATARQAVFRRMGEYFEFARKSQAFGQPAQNHEFFYSYALEKLGCTIGVAGLNTAWRCKDKTDRGRLIVGVPQLDAAVAALENTDLKILLMHHPPESDWFAVHDAIYQRHNLHEFDFVLRGHEHDRHTAQKSFHVGQAYCQVSAGALYTTGECAKSFNAVRVNLDLGVATVFFWRMTDHTYTWVKDLEVYKKGYELFKLSVGLSSRLAASARKAGGRRRPQRR